jgi:hypothetical protein
MHTSFNYEQSVILLKDKSFIQKKTYKEELLKAFQKLTGNTERGQEFDELDPKLVALKTTRNVQTMCLLNVYDKKKGSKVKSLGAKYDDGLFEAKAGGCMSSKVTKYTINTNANVFIEEKEEPKISVPWDVNNPYRLLAADEKDSVWLGVYSGEEFDLQRILFNIEHSKIAALFTPPSTQRLSLVCKYVLPSRYKGYIAQLFLEKLLEVTKLAKDFKQEGQNYDSIISDNEPQFTRKLNSSTANKDDELQSESDNLASSYDQDTNYLFGSLIPQAAEAIGSPVMAPASKASTHKIKSDFAKVNLDKSPKGSQQNISALKHPDQGGNVVKESLIINDHTQRINKSQRLQTMEEVSAVLAVHNPAQAMQPKTSTVLHQGESVFKGADKSDFTKQSKMNPVGILKKPPLPTESTISSNYKSTKKMDYFAPDLGGLKDVSTIGDRLLDVKHKFHEMSHLGKQSDAFTIASITVPAAMSYGNLVLEVYSFGIGGGNSSQAPQTADELAFLLKRVLLKNITCDRKKKNFSVENNCTRIELNEKVPMETTRYDYFEINVMYSRSNSIIGCKQIKSEMILELEKSEQVFSVPISCGKYSIILTLAPDNVVNNRDRKCQLSSQMTLSMVQNLAKEPNLSGQLDTFINEAIKQRKADIVASISRKYLPANYYLNIWLLVTKKFKPKDTATKEESSGQVVKFKSSIMQSLWVTKKDTSTLEINQRVSVHFHRLIKAVERMGSLLNSTGLFRIGGILESVQGEYFKSSLNQYKLLDYIFGYIMSDYFNMFLEDQTGDKNVLFSRKFRSCSRDYMVLHGFINLNCENILKVSQLNSRDIVLWAIDHILSVNIGFLKDVGIHHLNFLFLQSIRHKDTPHGFGWRINLYLHVFILSKLEKLLTQRLYSHNNVNYSMDYLYSLVTSSPTFYEEFIMEYLNFEKELAGRHNSSIGTFASLIKNLSDTSDNLSPMGQAEQIYSKFNETPDLREIFENNVLENIMVYQMARLNVKPNKLMSVVKAEKKEVSRRVFMKIHQVWNKDTADDEMFYTALVDGREIEFDKESRLVYNPKGVYPPALELRLHKIGDDLLYKNNNTFVGATSLQIRRFRPNVLHKTTLQVVHETTQKQYYISVSLLLLEPKPSSEDIESFNSERNPQFKYMGALGYLLLNNFKHPMSNFEELIHRKVAAMFEEVGAEIQDQSFRTKYSSASITGYHIQANMKELGVGNIKLADKQLQQQMDSFVMTLKILLFKKNFEMLEDYVIRYFGSDPNSITAAEAVYLMQCMLKIIDIRVHKLEIVSYIERVLKKAISMKLDSCSLLLGVDSDNPLSTRSHHIDLLRIFEELLSHQSFKRDSACLVYGDCVDLFLIRDIVDKMGMRHKVGQRNFLSVRYSIGEQSLHWSVSFDAAFKTQLQNSLAGGAIVIEDLLDSHAYSIDISPLDCIRITKLDLKQLFTQVPLIEYLRFCTHSVLA